LAREHGGAALLHPDDKAKAKPELRWAIPKSELVDEERFVLPLKTRDLGRNTGSVDLGPKHQDWCFSKSLFDDEASIAGAVAELVSKKMLG
jgi:hypothetical protein